MLGRELLQLALDAFEIGLVLVRAPLGCVKFALELAHAVLQRAALRVVLAELAAIGVERPAELSEALRLGARGVLRRAELALQFLLLGDGVIARLLERLDAGLRLVDRRIRWRLRGIGVRELRVGGGELPLQLVDARA